MKTLHALAAALAVGVLAIAAVPRLAGGVADEWKAPARAAKKKNPVAVDEASLAAGKKFYRKECESCHGTKGKGDGSAAKDLERSPGDLSNSKLWEQSDGALFWKISTGRKPMPAYEETLAETERWHVVNYVRTLAPKPAGAP